MPKATVSVEGVRHDLKSCEGGYVVLKRMTYGQKLERSQIATDLQIEMVDRKHKGNAKASVDVMQKKTALFELAACVLDHNLFEDDEETVKLDFTKPTILTKLDPRIGDEIGQIIDKMNNFELEDEDGEDLGN